MNKLDVAIRLLQLLNERKELDSKTVAHELNVSLRTAQRYLMELSALPCVINGRNHNSYTLDPTYQLNKAIINFGITGPPGETSKEKISILSMKQPICLLCGNNRKYFNDVFWPFDSRPISNKYKIDELTLILKRRLRGSSSSFSWMPNKLLARIL